MRPFFLATLLGLLSCLPAQAQIITAYDFAGQPGTEQTMTSSQVASGLDPAQLLVQGSNNGGHGQALLNSINSTNWTTGGTPNANNYYGFTVLPTAGNQVNVSGLFLNVIRGTAGPTSGLLRYSFDHFATFTDAGTFTIGTSASQTANLLSGTITGDSTNGIEFRIYAFNAANQGTNSNFALIGGTNAITPTPPYGVEVDGSVTAVPEPSTMLLTGLGLFGTGAFYARRKRQQKPAEAEKA